MGPARFFRLAIAYYLLRPRAALEADLY